MVKSNQCFSKTRIKQTALLSALIFHTHTHSSAQSKNYASPFSKHSTQRAIAFPSPTLFPIFSSLLPTFYLINQELLKGAYHVEVLAQASQ